MNGILAAVSQREFWNEDKIKEMVEKGLRALYSHVQSRTSTEEVGDLRNRLLFATGKQQTWLVADSLMAYCVLDDRRREEPRIQWKASLRDALPISVDDTWSAEAGLLHFGNRTKGWLYSKKLFAQEPVEAAVSKFLSESAVDLNASQQV